MEVLHGDIYITCKIQSLELSCRDCWSKMSLKTCNKVLIITAPDILERKVHSPYIPSLETGWHFLNVSLTLLEMVAVISSSIRSGIVIVLLAVVASWTWPATGYFKSLTLSLSHCWHLEKQMHRHKQTVNLHLNLSAALRNLNAIWPS